MRIAAGILLILTAIFNVWGGNAYRVLGAISDATAAETAAQPADAPLDPAAAAVSAEFDAKANASIHQATSTMGSSGALKALGLFLLAVAPLQLAGAITVFLRKAAPFVMGVAVLGIAAEVWSGVVGGFGLMNLIGVLAAVLAGLSAWSLLKGPSAPLGAALAAR